MPNIPATRRELELRWDYNDRSQGKEKAMREIVKARVGLSHV